MRRLTPEDVRVFLNQYLSSKLNSRGRDSLIDLAFDCDIMEKGLLDSLGLLELTVVIEQHFGHEIDFEMLDPEEMCVVGPLCNYVAEQINKA